MSVLTCDRLGCYNVMCDRLSHEYGYICNDCFDELVSLGATVDIYKFMHNDTMPSERVKAYARYNAEFELKT